MTNHSCKPYFVLKAVFHSFPSFILIWWHPFFKSILENTQDPCNLSSISSSLGMGCRYFTIRLLIAWQSTHILHMPSFLGANKIGTTHELMFSLIYHFPINSLTYLWSSFGFSKLLICASHFRMVTLDRKSIWCLNPQIRSKSCSVSSGKDILICLQERSNRTRQSMVKFVSV